MKKTLLTIIALLAMTTTAIAQNVADVVGTYKGDLYIQLATPINDETKPLVDQSIKLEAGEGNTINFALYNFSFGEAPLGDIILNNVGIKKEGNIFKFNDEKPVDLSFLGGDIKATAKINPGTSMIEGDKITANLDVFWVQSETAKMPIYVRFIGSKETATGIGQVATATASDAIYSINGVRMNASLDQLPKGIYIVNGKKLIK